MTDPVVVIGGGGHSRVVIDLLLERSVPVFGVVDPGMEPGTVVLRDVKILGSDDQFLSTYDRSSYRLVNGIGYIPNNPLRFNVYQFYRNQAYEFVSVISGSSVLSSSAELSGDVQVLHNAVIQANAKIGMNCIINTGAIVEHDVSVGDHCHIAPGAIICGGCRLQEKVFVGAGAIVLPGLTIGHGAVIGAGVTCTEDVPDHGFVARR